MNEAGKDRRERGGGGGGGGVVREDNEAVPGQARLTAEHNTVLLRDTCDTLLHSAVRHIYLAADPRETLTSDSPREGVRSSSPPSC